MRTLRSSRKRGKQTEVQETSKKRQKRAPIVPFRFFELPREIRDRVYDEVWLEKDAFPITFNHFRFAVSYADDPPSALPASQAKAHKRSKRPGPWFMASQQLAIEASEQFSRRAQWRLLEWPMDLRLVTKSTRRADVYRLSSPWTARVLILPETGGVSVLHMLSVDHNERAQGTMKFGASELRRFRQLSASQPAFINLKKLDIAFTIWLTPIDPKTSDPGTTVDFSALTILSVPSLQALTINIRFVSAASGFRRRLYEEVRNKVWLELRAVAASVLGGVPQYQALRGDAGGHHGWTYHFWTPRFRRQWAPFG